MKLPQAQKEGPHHTVFWVSGERYQGEWKDNKRHGEHLTNVLGVMRGLGGSRLKGGHASKGIGIGMLHVLLWSSSRLLVHTHASAVPVGRHDLVHVEAAAAQGTRPAQAPLLPEARFQDVHPHALTRAPFFPYTSQARAL